MNAAELHEAFDKLPPIQSESQWDKHRLALRKHIVKDGIEKFLRWSTIVATMFVGEAPYIELELDDLLKDQAVTWGSALFESTVGDPPRLSYCDWTSGNKVHQCYHLQQWIRHTSILPSQLRSVFEFGGGYGALCHVLHRMGFKGHYALADLPEFLLLQKYYLSQHDITAKFLSPPIFGGPGIVDLFVALFSFSEAPVDVRKYHIERVGARSYLFAYQPEWLGIDNCHWFQSVRDRMPNYKWWDYEAKYKPEYRYLIGVKK